MKFNTIRQIPCVLNTLLKRENSRPEIEFSLFNEIGLVLCNLVIIKKAICLRADGSSTIGADISMK